jgi:2,4-didehydro-3-deoxy-L-rhamnonate hydrolase
VRLLRYGPAGHERPAVMLSGADHRAVDLSELAVDIDGAFFTPRNLRIAAELATDPSRATVDIREVRLGAPIARPGTIYGIGLNYRDHMAQSGMDLPTEPVVFTKSPNSLVGPTDDIVVPRSATKLDWELEVGLVIGKQTSYLSSPEDAAECIAGYVAVNDLTERAWQLERGGQWLKGKSFPTANPAGPFLVTGDEVNMADLRLVLSVNGQVMQDGSTSSMIFGPHHLVWYLSQFLALEPGDLIDTGTPAGVGMGHKPPRWLVPGDFVEGDVGVLGQHRNRVISP